MIRELQPDLVLMDVQMPIMDGIQATKLIQAGWPTVRVIGFSDHASKAQAMLDAGAVAFVHKPEWRQVLLPVIRRNGSA